MSTATITIEEKQPGLAPAPTNYDQRYFPRWEVKKRVDYSENGETALLCYTRDLSLDGVSLVVFGNPPARHDVQLIINLSEKERFKARGRVAWSKSEPTHKLIGITFRNLNPKAHVLITRHAFEF